MNSFTGTSASERCSYDTEPQNSHRLGLCYGLPGSGRNDASRPRTDGTEPSRIDNQRSADQPRRSSGRPISGTECAQQSELQNRQSMRTQTSARFVNKRNAARSTMRRCTRIVSRLLTNSAYRREVTAGLRTLSRRPRCSGKGCTSARRNSTNPNQSYDD